MFTDTQPAQRQERWLQGALLALGLWTGATLAEPGRNGFAGDFDLRDSCTDWQAGFACYPGGQEGFYQLTAQCCDELTNVNPGFFLSGANHSDDLFMFIKHPICGLKPSSDYEVEGSVEFLSQAPTNCIGVGGDPGAGVYVKFGASTVEPAPQLQPDGIWRMNVDIGNQSNSGADAVVIGNIATSITNCHNDRYELKVLETPAPLIARSDPDGTLWILVGADSGFEGITSLVYTQVRIQIHRVKGRKGALDK